MRALLNSVHGKVFGIIPTSFCDVRKDACVDKSPQCSPGVALVPNEEFCLCTQVTVPSGPLIPLVSINQKAYDPAVA